MDKIAVRVTTCAETGTLVAPWDGLTTQAEQLIHLETNIGEAIAVYFEPEDLPKQVRLQFVDDPAL